MTVLDATIVTVALPSIESALHFSALSLEWTISAYTLAFGGFLLLGGRLGDVLGRRRMFVVGLLIFSVASLLGGLAATSAWLIAARAVQGLGGAIAAPASLALIGETFAEGPARTRAMGVYAAMSAAGGAVGLLLGGILTSALSWRWVLFVNVPIGVLVVLAALRVLPRSERFEGQLDIPGAVAATAGMTALVYGLVRAPIEGWTSPVTYGSFLIAAVLLIAFVVIELRSSHPTLPLRLLANRNRSASYIIMFLIAGSIFAVFFFLTLFLQLDKGYSAVKTGLAFLPFSVGIAVAAQAVTVLMRWIQPKAFVVSGPLICAASLFWLSRLSQADTYASGVLGPILLLSIGLGFTFVPLVLGATAGVEQRDLGIASAILNTAQEIGGTLGLAVLVTVAADATRNALHTAQSIHNSQLAQETAAAATLHGYSNAFVVASFIALGGFLVAIFGIPSSGVSLAVREVPSSATRSDSRPGLLGAQFRTMHPPRPTSLRTRPI
jgi:EmrB/QacA subfamily drug resistance transporter